MSKSKNEVIKNLLKEIDDENTSLVSEGASSAEYSGTIDTGCYILNAVLSGSLFGGMPNNKVSVFAGESSVGKTYLALGIVRSFLNSDPNAGILYYDTEAAITKQMMEQRGIDVERVIVAEPETLQQFKHHALKFIESYSKLPEKNRPPFMIVLDSLGILSTTKEMEDSIEGSDKKDMTRAGVIRAVFRTLRLKLAKAKIPMIVTNHTYTAVGSMYPTQEVSGGGGVKYAADQIAMLSKRKEKDGTDVIGNVIHIKMYKSRLSKENKVVDALLRYDSGLDKYYGLLPLAEKAGLVKKVSTRYEMPDGSKVFEKEINRNPEKYWTKDLLNELELFANKEFKYGSVNKESEPFEYDDSVSIEYENE